MPYVTCQMVEWRISPSSPRRGGCAINEMPRSIRSSRGRGGVRPQGNSVGMDHHPIRSLEEASQYFIEVADTPPRRGGERAHPRLLSYRSRYGGQLSSPTGGGLSRLSFNLSWARLVIDRPFYVGCSCQPQIVGLRFVLTVSIRHHVAYEPFRS